MDMSLQFHRLVLSAENRSDMTIPTKIRMIPMMIRTKLYYQ